MPVRLVSCRDLPDVAWLNWTKCPFKDNLAVFSFQLDDQLTDRSYVKSLLQPDECLRAERYHQDDDRNRFMYARGFLRIVAGRYLNQAPERVRFVAGINRKPMLAGGAGWHFNVSHSGDCILLAFADGRIGVDVEKLNPEFPFQDLLPVSFSKAEQDYINGNPTAHQRFYQLWTRKEALLKATAKGIDDDFGQIPSLIGQHRVESRLISGTENWLVDSFRIPAGYLAAVAYPVTVEMPKFYTGSSVLFQQ